MAKKVRITVEVTPAMANMLLRLLPHGKDDPKTKIIGPLHAPTFSKIHSLIWDMVAATHPEDGPYK
jgi:hypothetical protein